MTSLPPDLHTAPRLALLQLASNPLGKEEAALLASGLDQVRAIMAARGTKPLQVELILIFSFCASLIILQLNSKERDKVC